MTPASVNVCVFNKPGKGEEKTNGPKIVGTKNVQRNKFFRPPYVNFLQRPTPKRGTPPREKPDVEVL